MARDRYGRLPQNRTLRRQMHGDADVWRTPRGDGAMTTPQMPRFIHFAASELLQSPPLFRGQRTAAMHETAGSAHAGVGTLVK